MNQSKLHDVSQERHDDSSTTTKLTKQSFQTITHGRSHTDPVSHVVVIQTTNRAPRRNVRRVIKQEQIKVFGSMLQTQSQYTLPTRSSLSLSQFLNKVPSQYYLQEVPIIIIHSNISTRLHRGLYFVQVLFYYTQTQAHSDDGVFVLGQKSGLQAV